MSNITKTELEQAILDGRPFNSEEIEVYTSLTDVEREHLADLSIARNSKIKDKKLKNQIDRVIQKEVDRLISEKQEIPKGLLSDCTLDEYRETSNYSLNEGLILVYQDPDTPADIKEYAFEIFFQKNIGLVGSVLKKFSTKSDGKISMEDLSQEAHVAFIRAMETFNVSKGYRFTTYFSTVATNALIAVFKNKVNKMREREFSFDVTVSNDKGGAETSILDLIADPNAVDPASTVMWESESKLIYEALNNLDLSKKFIAYARFGLVKGIKKSQNDLSRLLGMSQANVSKIENTMLEELKQELIKLGMY